ncbi:galactoside O-acetyltransferase/dTDP-4-amino-4,6-dideoxygalactose transaminase [Marinobacter antarcticus]|jgi:acetyltransferase-like isoleucine patch superfamily enzyme|uniref:Galactoside O-acetyltransferase/dTDP-4-amino-4,6-dideoxygalactose transaminase n=1 Tax=Marinobacter antarcticus TaxID=564117 RepID=A0A1M6VZ23_9GAMM|nr:acyltransferase [Marinobacter antarcticus]SHK86674.1 galactoside O-acetyltransferase/dTDP-4-amino-4,6-dideoxygalactose transaminase [Marinobacter antarcticus]
MGYLSESALEELNFKSLGQGVKISDKASIYNAELMEIGDFSRVDDFCVLSGKVVLGCYCHVAPMCLIAGGEPGVELKDFSGLAYGVKIFAQSDDYSGETMIGPLVPSKYKRERFASVLLERQVIVGTNAVIFPGVTVAEGCAIGAMALVTKSTEPWAMYVGNPARWLKARKKDLNELESRFLQEKDA